MIRERPGEPRFGLDLERSGTLETWNDLAWSDVAPAASRFIPVGDTIPARTLTEPSPREDGGAKHLQWQEDRALAWRGDMTAADVAYILYQAPVLVAVHAREMLAR